MNPDHAAELLGRLSAKTHSWEPSIRAHDTLTAADVNLALALIPSALARALARVNYLEQREHRHELADRLAVAIAHATRRPGDAKVARWPRPDFLRDMCRLAVYELVHPRRCPDCKGRGFVGGTRRNHKRRECARCNPMTHHVPYTDAARADALGVRADAWRHSWADRYEAILDRLAHYDAVLKGSLAKRLDNGI